jgi:hypothetical protein
MRKTDSRKLTVVLRITEDLMTDFYENHPVTISQSNSGDTFRIDLTEFSALVKQLSVTGLFLNNLLFKNAGVSLQAGVFTTLGGGHISKKDIPENIKMALSKNDVQNLMDLHNLIASIVVSAKESGFTHQSHWLISASKLFDLTNSIMNIYLKV